MKTLVTNYTFSAAAKQVTLTDYPSIRLDQILLITNVTDNIIIYNFADPTAGGTLAGNVLTLGYNTAAMSDSDRLQIFIDDYVVPSTEASLTAVRIRIDNTNTLLNVLTARQDTINISASTINLNTDEVEGLIRTTNSNLTGIDLDITTFNTQVTGQILTFNRQLTGQLDTFNRQLTGQVLTINQNVSATNPRLSSIDVKLTTLINQTDQIEGYIDGIENHLQLIENSTANIPIASNQQTRTVQLSSGLDCGTFYIWSIEGTSFANYDQYIQVRDGDDNALLFTQKIKANENFKFNFWPNGPGQLHAPNENIIIYNSLTPFTHTPGYNDLYLYVRGIEF